jgi:hypothetical protein
MNMVLFAIFYEYVFPMSREPNLGRFYGAFFGLVYASVINAVALIVALAAIGSQGNSRR